VRGAVAEANIPVHGGHSSTVPHYLGRPEMTLGREPGEMSSIGQIGPRLEGSSSE